MSDTRFTDYALGELTGSAREKFERELAKSDSLQAELNDIITMASKFDRMPKSAEGLDPKARIDLLHACEENQAAFRRKKTLIRWAAPLGLAAAASLIFLPYLTRPAAPSPSDSYQKAKGAGTVYYEPSPLLGAQNSALDVKPNLEIEDSNSSSQLSSGRLFPASEYNTPINQPSDRADLKSAKENRSEPLESRITYSECPMPFEEKIEKMIHLDQQQKEVYSARNGGRFVDAKSYPQSVLAFHEDLSCYNEIRKQIERGELPSPSSVRIEDLINAFSYDYPRPHGEQAFSTNLEISQAPWNEQHLLLRVGIQGRDNSSENGNTSSLDPIARNVKAEIAFNPTKIKEYRLIGYEYNNALDIKKIRPTAEVFSSYTHTALYEIVLSDQPLPQDSVNETLKTKNTLHYEAVDIAADLLTVKLHHLPPGATKCRLLITRLPAKPATSFEKSSDDLRFAAAVAAFGLKLRHSPELEKINWSTIQQIASSSLGNKFAGQRSHFANLIEKTSRLPIRVSLCIPLDEKFIADILSQYNARNIL